MTTRRTTALLGILSLMTSCGTVIPVPDAMFADDPRNRVEVGGTNPASAPQRTGAPARRAVPVPGKPGFAYSPYAEGKLIDVRGLPAGITIDDPYTGGPVVIP